MQITSSCAAFNGGKLHPININIVQNNIKLYYGM